MQVFSFASKRLQGFSSDRKILMLLLSVLFHAQNFHLQKTAEDSNAKINVFPNIPCTFLLFKATTSQKIYWDNHPLQSFSPPPSFNQCWKVWQLHQDYAANKLLTHNIDIGQREGSLNGAIFRFFERKP